MNHKQIPITLKVFAGLLLGIALIVYAVLLVSANAKIHIREQQWRLLEDEYFNGSANYLFAITKYLNQMELYQQQINREERDLREQQATYMLSMNPELFPIVTPESNIELAAFKLTNMLRTFTNRRLFPSELDKQALVRINYALHLIMSKDYVKALALLEGLFSAKLPKLYQGHVVLHIAFCKAMLGDYQYSANIYHSVSSQYGNDRVAGNARRLLKEVNAFRKELQSNNNDTTQSIETIRKHAMLLDCRTVLQNTLDTSNFSAEDRSNYWYFRGFCEEEQNTNQLAAKSYLRSIQLSRDSAQVRDANRRLFLATQFTDSLANYHVLSKKIQEQFHDSTYTKIQTINKTNERLHDSILLGHTNKQKSSDPQNDSTISPISIDSMPMPMDAFLARIQSSFVMNDPIIDTVVKKTLPKKVKTQPKTIQAPPQEFHIGSFVEIRMINHRRFRGILQSDPADSFLKLKTIVGIISIPRNQVQAITDAQGFEKSEKVENSTFDF